MDKRRQELIDGAIHWEALADREDEQADWDHAHGYGDVTSFRNRAKLYRRTAKSLRLEAETGRPHCTNCLGDHPNHECKTYKK